VAGKTIEQKRGLVKDITEAVVKNFVILEETNQNMSTCKPFGNPQNSKIMVVGHDPRLRKSETEAEYCFFLEYLALNTVTSNADKQKKAFAETTVEYIRSIVGSEVQLEDIYFTNLCNRFLSRPIIKGTVLIPDVDADNGIDKIENTINSGSFLIILSMSLQVFYHLARTGFMTESGKELKEFIEQAKPDPKYSAQNAYKSLGKSPFLSVCGQIFHHRYDSIPIVPILHVNQFNKPLMEKSYRIHMDQAKQNVRMILNR
jgi:hypothetical protein